VVQTITSSVDFVTGSTRFGSLLDNTHVFTGSMNLTGSLTVVTTGTEFQVNANGVKFGNVIGDAHNITGSVGISGSATFVGNVQLTNANPTISLITNTSTTATMFQIVGAQYVASAPFNANRLVAANSSHIAFETGGSERMRITSGGDVNFLKAVYINSASGLSGEQGFLFFNYSPSNAGSRSWRISNDQTDWGDFVIQSSATQTGGITNTPLKITSNGNITASNLLLADRLSLTSFSALYGKKVVKADNVSSFTFNLSTMFPEMSSTFGSNVVGCFGVYTIFRGGAAETGIFSISRNGGGSWSSPAFSVQTATGAYSLSTVTASGTSITMVFNTAVYVIVEVTAMIE
jgi:hypothetical protein